MTEPLKKDVRWNGGILAAFDRTVSARPSGPAIHYFDQSLSFSELDDLASAFAGGLKGLGVQPGDRVALILQNVPQFLIALLGSWRAECIAVPLNPMYRKRELNHHLCDSGARVVVCLESIFEEVKAASTGSNVDFLVTTSEVEWLGSQIPSLLLHADRYPCSGSIRFHELLESGKGRSDVARSASSSMPALLSYTSGTTGVAKGAVISHGNIAFSSAFVREWLELSPDDVIAGIAPLFHITGLITYVTVSMQAGSSILLNYRFDAPTVLELASTLGATCTVAPITAYTAFLDYPDAARFAFSSLRKAVSGGAPVASATVRRFDELTGVYIHNAYGLTETTSVALRVPLGDEAPIDRESGALSVGIPLPRTEIAIVDPESGREVADGTVGEISIRGPHVVLGYWGDPNRTSEAIQEGWLRTGDLGKRDVEGWFYVIDRAKDVINASGFKIWPREVEDVLYECSCVKEACVVGQEDAYRGETVVGYVVLREGHVSTEAELIEHCRSILAVYKCPRSIVFVDSLPKTASGKLLRREIRDRAHPKVSLS